MGWDCGWDRHQMKNTMKAIIMKRGYYHKRWYVWFLRIVLLGFLSVTLWASTIAAPFVCTYILNLRGTFEKVGSFAIVAGSVAVVIGFVCYLLDRI